MIPFPVHTFRTVRSHFLGMTTVTQITLIYQASIAAGHVGQSVYIQYVV
jgi:hypothetical protein